MVSDRVWAKNPKPKVDVAPPQDIPNPADLIGRTRLLFDLTHLALQTDSTRLITIMLAGSTASPPIEGVNPSVTTTSRTTARIRASSRSSRSSRSRQ